MTDYMDMALATNVLLTGILIQLTFITIHLLRRDT